MDAQKERRWRLALSTDLENADAQDRRMSKTLSMIYPEASENEDGKKGGSRGGSGTSAPAISKWMGDVRELFPETVVEVLQKDALEKFGFKALLGEPEVLKSLEPNVHLVADLMTLRGAIPETAKQAARDIIEKLVIQLMAQLERKMADTVRGSLNRSKRTHRPRFSDIDWARTIKANMATYQPDRKIIIPERLVGFTRHTKRQVDLDEVHLVIDQSGSMGPSVIYSSIFSAVLASLPVVKTRLVAFDTQVVDWTDQLDDPVEVLWGIQLGGGTDINKAVAYAQDKIETPGKAHMVLVTDLYEGGNQQDLVKRLAKLKEDGVNVIVLLALSDQGKPFHNPHLSRRVADLGVPVFACTPDQFPDLMGAALRRDDVAAWAASQGIKTISSDLKA